MTVALIVIGTIANVLNVCYNIPLVYRPWKNRCIDDISTYFITMRILGTMLWIAYGVADNVDVQLIILNCVTLSSSLCLVLFVILQKYGVCGFVSRVGRNAIVPSIDILPVTIHNNPK
jgi:uncharacterized protein with PQ loop repeat|eukprot:TRINITY_DN13339_c3_g1_i1.p1 TRINITY_DN13339_c3_g1~~TRINITY_DN13339_c3_g1_i1.p1  ORF type:complete len:118 (-),score=44.61 TRINITY_DN13339_c3_g1_i1:166-519(-)